VQKVVTTLRTTWFNFDFCDSAPRPGFTAALERRSSAANPNLNVSRRLQLRDIRTRRRRGGFADHARSGTISRSHADPVRGTSTPFRTGSGSVGLAAAARLGRAPARVTGRCARAAAVDQPTATSAMMPPPTRCSAARVRAGHVYPAGHRTVAIPAHAAPYGGCEGPATVSVCLLRGDSGITRAAR